MVEAAENLEQNEETWVSSIEDEGLKETLGKFESQDKLFEAIGYKPEVKEVEKDWREGLDEELKKTADRFASPADAIRSIQDLRKRESLVRVPGKGASKDEIAAYNKAIGVPEKPENYEFPDLPEGYELTDEVKSSRETWGKRFHELGVSNNIAKQLMQFVNEDAESIMTAEIRADQEFARAQEDALRVEWKGEDYEKNKGLANKAFTEIANRAGVPVDELTKLETKNGRFLMDDARILRLFSVIGREMAEGTLGPTLTESELDTAEEQLGSIRKKIAEAQSAGNSKLANKLYQSEQALIAKMKGDKPVVGAAGRSV